MGTPFSSIPNGIQKYSADILASTLQTFSSSSVASLPPAQVEAAVERLLAHVFGAPQGTTFTEAEIIDTIAGGAAAPTGRRLQQSQIGSVNCVFDAGQANAGQQCIFFLDSNCTCSAVGLFPTCTCTNGFSGVDCTGDLRTRAFRFLDLRLTRAPSPPVPPSTSMCPALFGGLVASTSVVA